MREVGIDITDQTPKLLEYVTAESSDVIVTMGCGDACPVFPGKRYEDCSGVNSLLADRPTAPVSVDWMFEPTATSGIIACVCGSSRS